MRMSYYSETFHPSDVEVLQNVYDRVCKERGLSPEDTTENENLAAEIVRLRMLGIVNEDELLRAVNAERELRRA